MNLDTIKRLVRELTEEVERLETEQEETKDNPVVDPKQSGVKASHMENLLKRED